MEYPINMVIVTTTFGNKFNVSIFSENSLPITAEEFGGLIDNVLTKEILKE